MPRGGIDTQHASLHVITSTDIAIAAKDTYYPITHASQVVEDAKRFMKTTPTTGRITPAKGRVKVSYRMRITGTAAKVYRTAILKNGTAHTYGTDTVTELGLLVGEAILDVDGDDYIQIGIKNETDTTTPVAVTLLDFVVTELEARGAHARSS